MNKTGIEKAIAEAEEFIERANAALDEAIDSKYTHSLYPTAKTGALRRQSMELTRALAEMRKS